MQTVVFTKVFKAEGTSARGPWTRWDYKTEEGGRFPHFAATQEIPLNAAVNVQTSAKGDVKEWQIAGSQQPTVQPSVIPPAPSPHPASAAPASSGATVETFAFNTNVPATAVGGPSEKDTQIHRQTATKVAAELLPLFPKAEQTTDTMIALSKRLVHFYAHGE